MLLGGCSKRSDPGVYSPANPSYQTVHPLLNLFVSAYSSGSGSFKRHVCERAIQPLSPRLGTTSSCGVSRGRGVAANSFPASTLYRLLLPSPGRVVGTEDTRSSWCMAFGGLVVLVIAHCPARYGHEDSGWNGWRIPADTGVRYWCCPGDLARYGRHAVTVSEYHKDRF